MNEAVLYAIIATNALMSDDDLKNADAQAVIDRYFMYLDSMVPAMKKRLEYYEQNYGMRTNREQPGFGMEDIGKIAELVKGFLK